MRRLHTFAWINVSLLEKGVICVHPAPLEIKEEVCFPFYEDSSRDEMCALFGSFGLVNIVTKSLSPSSLGGIDGDHDRLGPSI